MSLAPSCLPKTFSGVSATRRDFPDHREDLKNRSTQTTKGYFIGTLVRDLFFGSSQWSGFCAVRIEPDVSPLSTEGLWVLGALWRG